MNSKTAKLLNSYSRETGRSGRDIKDWWRSLVDEDRDRARRSMTVFVEKRRKEKKDREMK